MRKLKLTAVALFLFVSSAIAFYSFSEPKEITINPKSGYWTLVVSNSNGLEFNISAPTILTRNAEKLAMLIKKETRIRSAYVIKLQRDIKHKQILNSIPT